MCCYNNELSSQSWVLRNYSWHCGVLSGSDPQLPYSGLDRSAKQFQVLADDVKILLQALNLLYNAWFFGMCWSFGYDVSHINFRPWRWEDDGINFEGTVDRIYTDLRRELEATGCRSDMELWDLTENRIGSYNRL